MPYIPPPTANDVVRFSNELSNLIVDLEAWQRRTKDSWAASRDASDPVTGDIGLLNHLGDLTIIPDFLSYDRLWLHSGFQNPFDVHWSRCDFFNHLTVQYLAILIETLDEQSVLWGVDQRATISLVFENFIRFLGSIRKLYTFCVTGEVDTGTVGTASMSSSSSLNDF